MTCECEDVGGVFRWELDGCGEESLMDALGLDLYKVWSCPTVEPPSSAMRLVSSSSETEDPCRIVIGGGDCAFVESTGEVLAAEYLLLKDGTLKLGGGDILCSGEVVRSEGPEFEIAAESGRDTGVGVG